MRRSLVPLLGLLCFLRLVASAAAVGSQQHVLSDSPTSRADLNAKAEDYWKPDHEIKRVAVIGGGPTGLLHAATLVEHGFDVRMFERAPKPGGNWLYSERRAVSAEFPNRPLDTLAYIPDIPPELPFEKICEDGEEGISNDWRIREHWAPSATWANMVSTVPPFEMTMPNIQYAPDTPWSFNNRLVQRHVRQYASSVSLNSNDESNITSYSTRVERIHKPSGSRIWTVTLRRMVELPPRLGKGKVRVKAEYWTEDFDAVVVGTNSESDAAWVPPIPGLGDWARAFPERVFHSREYRRPEGLSGKKVLVVGGFFSAGGIASDLARHGSEVWCSVRWKDPSEWDPIQKGIASLFPSNATFVPEIGSFSGLPTGSGVGVEDAQIRLLNGTTISGFHSIILATGYRKSFPFLAGFHNTSIVGHDEPETRVPPIITDGTHRRSLHWTGHYIPDPTLALATIHPWTLGAGPYQALGFAKVWSNKARLPSTAQMWKEYPGAGKELATLQTAGEFIHRLFVTWLNDANLEFGGRLVQPPAQFHQAYEYFSESWLPGLFTAEYYAMFDNLPRSQWPVRNGKTQGDSDLGSGTGGLTAASMGWRQDDWAELQPGW